jgi:DNA polymerase-1
VFEVAQAHVDEAASLVKERMESAIELEVPLRADVGWGASWTEAAPEGH